MPPATNITTEGVEADDDASNNEANECEDMVSMSPDPIDIVKDNLEKYSAQHIKMVAAARQLYVKIERPGGKQFRQWVAKGIIRGTNVNTEGIDNALAVRGEDVGAIQGAVTRARTQSIIDNAIQPPLIIPEHAFTITMSAGIFFVNSLPFYITLLREIRFNIITILRSWDATNIVEGVITSTSIVCNRGIIITELHINE